MTTVAATLTDIDLSIRSVLVRRDGLTRRAADAMIDEARQRVRAGEHPEDILLDDFGLEPDYIYDLF